MTEQLEQEAQAAAPKTPVFDEVANMTAEQAVNVLVQAAQLAQSSGNLTVRDSVMLAKAINVVMPGSL